MTSRCILIGLDGATFTILDPLIREGIMPVLGRVMASGARAELLSTIPPLTPPAWTSMMTGRSPGWHGILDFARAESADSRYVRFISSRDVKCETVWSIAARQGRRAAALNFPATSPAPAIDGVVIPGWTPWRWLRRNCRPRDIIASLEAIPGFDAQTLAIRTAEELKAINGCAQEDFEPWARLHTERDRQWRLVIDHVLRERDCALTSIVFDGVDKIQHLCWRFLDPGLPQEDTVWFRRVREVCLDYFRLVDQSIGEIMTLAGPDATILLASDHGFGRMDMRFNVNAWLHSRGLLEWRGGPADEDEAQNDATFAPRVHELYRKIDWERTRAYALVASSNGIWIPHSGARGTLGVEPAQYEEVRDSLIDGLLALRDPQFDEPIVRHVWKREEIFDGPAMDLAPDLTLELRDHGVVSVNRAASLVERRPEIMGCHRPEGVFVAHGPGVKAGAALEPLSILDVAPTILYALGLPKPEDFEGRVAAEAFERNWLRSHPVMDGPATLAPSLPGREASRRDEEGEAQISMRLKALGYEG